MKHFIDLSELTTHGKAEMELIDNILDIWTTHSITPLAFNLYGDSYKGHYISLPGKYFLPFRLDMTIKLEYPSLILLIGGGHLTFSTQWQDNRKIEDIVKSSGKPNQDHYFYNNNSLPLGEFVDISITYNFDEMQIIIGGEERFYSRKQVYMKAKNLKERSTEGFPIGIAVSKLSKLSIKSITVTEYDEQAPITRGAFEEVSRHANEERPKFTFESVISELPSEFQDEVIETDKFLKSLRPLRFKRMVDKRSGKISYVSSDFGISYVLNASGTESMHHFGWYIVFNGKPETWHRKADCMEEALTEVAKINPQLAERIFYALSDCVGCYGQRCLAKTLYTFSGQKRLACHGRVVLRMCHDDFCDVREFLRYLNELMERKMADGEMPEKIMLIK